MSHDAARERLWRLVEDHPTAMMTTMDGELLRARPMRGHADPLNDAVWFFTRASAPKVDEIEDGQQVGLAYADPTQEEYVSISGRADLVRDRQKIGQLWNAFAAAWLPEGPDDPDVALIRVSAEQGEFWDGPRSRIVQLGRIAKARLTGEEPDMGEHERVQLGGDG
jgi:general stress protein 26